jgi:hypothetical protein
MNFFATSFPDAGSELRYRQESWFVQKACFWAVRRLERSDESNTQPVALWCSVFLIVNWAFAFIFVIRPMASQDKIFFGGVSLVILHVGNDHSTVPDCALSVIPHLLHDHVRLSKKSKDHSSGLSFVGDVVLVRHYLLFPCITSLRQSRRALFLLAQVYVRMLWCPLFYLAAYLVISVGFTIPALLSFHAEAAISWVFSSKISIPYPEQELIL